MNNLHKTKNILIYPAFFILTSMSFFSCSLTRHLKPGEQLLLTNEVVISEDYKKIKNPGFEEYEIEDLIKPKTNSKLFGIRIYLRLFNVYSPEKITKKEKKHQKKCEQKNKKKIDKLNSHDIKNLEYWRNQFEKGTKEYRQYDKKLKAKQEKRNQIQQRSCKKRHWTQSSGEAPVVYNSNQEYRNIKQIKIFLKNKGYYNAEVTSEKIDKNENKTSIKYDVKLNKPYIINHVYYYFEDSVIEKIVLKDTANCLLKQKNRLDIEVLENERNRITNYLRDKGYYKFTKEYIYYTVDSTFDDFSAHITLNLKQAKNINGKKINHKKYKINNVYIYPAYDPKRALAEKEKYFAGFDTSIFVEKNTYNIITDKQTIIKPKALTRGIYIHNDSIYKITNIRDSYKYLSSLKIIKIANIDFVEIKKPIKNDSANSLIFDEYLDCNIKITQNMLQSFTAEVEGTNTSGNIGMAGNMNYSHLNIFKNAEILDLNIKGSLERQENVSNNEVSEQSNTGFFNSKELGFDLSLRFPRMLAPSKLNELIPRFNPQTSLSTNYNFLVRPDYTRTIVGINLAYIWNSSENTKHIFKPVLLDLIKLRNATPEFIQYIYRLNLFDSYEDHLIFGSAYSIIINNQVNKKGKDFTYLKINGKIAGNSLYGIMSITNIEKQDGSYRIADNIFAQFAKADIDFRYYRQLPRANDKIIFRIFGGAILPYGNLQVAPFGEKFFAGGANGIRAWQVRSLGPGSYVIPSNTGIYPNQTGDLQLEGNFEYRMKLFWMMEGALFVDAGNIWAINKQDVRTGAIFQISDFYKEIAIGTGIGFRFDFDFFIIRFDFGLKLKDPALPENSRWIPLNRKFNSDEWTFNIGIGYPF